MTKLNEALRLADALIVDDKRTTRWEAADELRRLHHNSFVLTQALWKACGDDEDVVNATIESQGGLK